MCRIMFYIMVVTIGFYALLCYYILHYYYMYAATIKYDRIFIFLPPPRHNRRWRGESTAAAAAAAAAASDRRFTTSFIRTLYYIRQKMYIIKLFNVCTTYYYYYYYKCFVSVFRRSRFLRERDTMGYYEYTHTHTHTLYAAVINSDYTYFLLVVIPAAALFLFCFSAQTVPEVSLKKFTLYTRELYGIFVLLLHRKAVRALMISNGDRYTYFTGWFTEHDTTRFRFFGFGLSYFWMLNIYRTNEWLTSVILSCTMM